eukprot:Awhi_evm1s13882
MPRSFDIGFAVLVGLAFLSFWGIRTYLGFRELVKYRARNSFEFHNQPTFNQDSDDKATSR